ENVDHLVGDVLGVAVNYDRHPTGSPGLPGGFTRDWAIVCCHRARFTMAQSPGLTTLAGTASARVASDSTSLAEVRFRPRNERSERLHRALRLEALGVL